MTTEVTVFVKFEHKGIVFNDHCNVKVEQKINELELLSVCAIGGNNDLAKYMKTSEKLVLLEKVAKKIGFVPTK